jgi:hypothetical protein
MYTNIKLTEYVKLHVYMKHKKAFFYNAAVNKISHMFYLEEK